MNTEELDKVAQWLYDYDIDEWYKFTDEELLKLVELCKITKDNPFGRAYDDEVFTEMERRGLKANENN